MFMQGLTQERHIKNVLARKGSFLACSPGRSKELVLHCNLESYTVHWSLVLSPIWLRVPWLHHV